MKHNDQAEALSRLEQHVRRARDFSGWRFDDMARKRLGPDLPWNYTQRATELLDSAHTVLDMGTGGAEIRHRAAFCLARLDDDRAS